MSKQVQKVQKEGADYLNYLTTVVPESSASVSVSFSFSNSVVPLQGDLLSGVRCGGAQSEGMNEDEMDLEALTTDWAHLAPRCLGFLYLD